MLNEFEKQRGWREFRVSSSYVVIRVTGRLDNSESEKNFETNWRLHQDLSTHEYTEEAKEKIKILEKLNEYKGTKFESDGMIFIVEEISATIYPPKYEKALFLSSLESY